MSRHKIENISKTGFTLYIDSVANHMKWNEIQSIRFITPENLDVIKKDNSKYMILPDCTGMLEFIKRVPAGIDNYDYEYVEEYFSGLKSCKVCGLYSTKDDKCLNCGFSLDYMKKHLRDDSV